MKISFFSGLFLAFVCSQAQAFSLSDHQRMTEQAVLEYTTCFPGPITPGQASDLICGDLNEDLNVFVKDLVFSHYYNPDKKLEMFRFDSSVRVENLEEQMASQQTTNFDDLGHLIHHLQDMAAPPHVVPVNHWFTDGFENHVSVSVGFASGYSCADLQSFQQHPLPLQEVLRETAKSTLKSVRQGIFRGSFTDTSGHAPYPINVPYNWFWIESPENSFGQYGVLGDTYGQSSINYANGQVVITPAQTYEFKRHQMQLAVQATLQAMAAKLHP